MQLFEAYIKPYVKRFKWLMIATILLGILTILTSSMLTFTSGYLITRASEMPLNILMIYVPIVGVRLFGIARPVAHYLERLAGHNTVLKILAEMRVRLYEALEPQALFIRSRFQTGDILGTLADDIEHLQDAYIRTIFPVVAGLFLFLYSVVTLAYFDWRFALWMALCLAAVVFIYPLVSLYILKKRQIQLKEKRIGAYRILTDAVFGITDWMISGKKDELFQSFRKVSDESRELDAKISRWNHSRTFQLQVLSGIILIFVGVWAGFAASEGVIAPAYIASFTLVTLPLLEGLIPISNAVEKVPTYQESLQRIDKISRYKNKYEAPLQLQAPRGKPDIFIKNVTYYYPEKKEPAIKNITLKIPSREKVALLGKSGSGKSTFLQLLYGSLEPQLGNVRINGHKPHEYGEKIHDLLSVLNQKPYLFATSVANNIRLGRDNATDEEIQEVIRQVKLDRYINSLPNGIHTQMEETGQRFSGGERQRIALARILLKNNPIVILDEPTVGLDPITEAGLLETIFETLKDKTVILITHHLIGLEHMDRIIFFDSGEIAMDGTHRKLMEKNERYRKLYRMDQGEV